MQTTGTIEAWQAKLRAPSLAGWLKGILAALVGAATAFAVLWHCRRVGARPRALGRPLVRNPSNVEIGDDVVIDSRSARVELASHRKGRLIIGHDVWIGPGSRLTAARYVEIGDRVRIGANCIVSDEGSVATGEGAGIWIGDGVTMGDRVVVAPGTVIGAGAVVASGSAVSGRIPAGAIVNGGVVSSSIGAAVAPGSAVSGRMPAGAIVKGTSASSPGSGIPVA